MVDVAALAAQMNEDVAALMVTIPTLWVCLKREIHKIADLMHAKGGLLYMDGANMNALVGKARPGDFGVDVMHLNLHKNVLNSARGRRAWIRARRDQEILEPFLPTPVVVTKPDGTMAFEYNRPQSVGRVRAFYGTLEMFIRALAYIFANGPDGLRQTTEDAVLNANYIRKGLEAHTTCRIRRRHARVVFSDKVQFEEGREDDGSGQAVNRLRISSVHDSISADRGGCADDRANRKRAQRRARSFIEAMKSIAEEVEEDPQFVLEAPHNTRISRLDETLAARKPVLKVEAGNAG